MVASRQHRQKLYEQLVGQTVGERFEITSLLGFGGMGAVYKAVQRNMRRDVALKVIPSHDPTTTARFEREALTISKLHHPNTVTVFDYGQTDQGLLFLAMELLDGHNLSDLIADRGLLTPNQAVHIACQVGRSLHEAHDSDIVHRDVKPDNIFLIEVDDDPLFVKVLDFGIAKIVRGDDDVELTGTGRIIGTPKYMSPEQILAESVDHRSDIYSLACIVFEMLCGSPPFQDTSTTKLMMAHAHQPPPAFSERISEEALARIPGPLEPVVRRALSKSPTERQDTIGAFRDELRGALEATDHKRRISQLRDPDSADSPSTARSSSELTDSSDLLAQHSSQTLARLNPPTGSLSAPAAQSQEPGRAEAPLDEPAQKTDASSGRSPAVYAILAVLVAIAALLAYKAFQTDAPQRPATTAPPPPTAAAPAPTVELRVLTEPKGADVFEQGRYVGKTPMTIDAPQDASFTYRFEHDGYRPKTASHTVDADKPDPKFMVELDKKSPPPSKRPTPPSDSTKSASKPSKSPSHTLRRADPPRPPTSDKHTTGPKSADKSTPADTGPTDPQDRPAARRKGIDRLDDPADHPDPTNIQRLDDDDGRGASIPKLDD